MYNENHVLAVRRRRVSAILWPTSRGWISLVIECRGRALLSTDDHHQNGRYLDCCRNRPRFSSHRRCDHVRPQAVPAPLSTRLHRRVPPSQPGIHFRIQPAARTSLSRPPSTAAQPYPRRTQTSTQHRQRTSRTLTSPLARRHRPQPLPRPRHQPRSPGCATRSRNRDLARTARRRRLSYRPAIATRRLRPSRTCPTPSRNLREL
jgi:hypothetical protein